MNSFLESINDYLKLKDEELALSISAQRVEGYDVEGISEEIDKVKKQHCCENGKRIWVVVSHRCTAKKKEERTLDVHVDQKHFTILKCTSLRRTRKHVSGYKPRSFSNAPSLINPRNNCFFTACSRDLSV